MTDVPIPDPEPPIPGGPLDPNTPPPPPPKKKGQRHEEDNSQSGNADESESATSGTKTDPSETNE